MKAVLITLILTFGGVATVALVQGQQIQIAIPVGGGTASLATLALRKPF
jgi:hypothetical protein